MKEWRQFFLFNNNNNDNDDDDDDDAYFPQIMHPDILYFVEHRRIWNVIIFHAVAIKK